MDKFADGLKLECKKKESLPCRLIKPMSPT